MRRQIVRAIKYIILGLAENGFLNFLPDSMYLKIIYRLRIGKKLNLIQPITFNEKLQWLKLHDRKELYVTLVDKIEVKKYIAKTIGEKYVVPTIGIWKDTKEIDFELLPEKFVLKCSHDSGSVVICKDKRCFDKIAAINKLESALKRNAFWYGREWPYKHVSPQIIAEKYLESDDQTEGLRDYKFHVFNGKTGIILVCGNRFEKGAPSYDFFDRMWNHLDISRPGCCNSSTEIPEPQMLEEMLHVAELISQDIPFCRVDFYLSGEQIYLGEITFYPTSGFTPFIPDKWDERIGEYLVI